MAEADTWRAADEKTLLDEEAVVTKAALSVVNDLASALRSQAADGEISDSEVTRDHASWQEAVDDRLLPAIGEVYARAYDWQMAQFENGDFATKKVSADARTNAAAYVKTIRNRLVGVADDIFADIRRELSQALTDGESPQQMAARINRVFANRGGNNWLGRASVIAQTETAAAINAGRMQAARKYAKDNDLPRTAITKVWLTEHDDKVREAHAAVHGDRKPLTQPFIVGGVKMQQPGDPTAPPELTINCRCLVRFLAGRTASGEDDPMTDTITEPEVDERQAAEGLEPISVPWHGVLAPEGVMSGDRRKFSADSLRHRDLPLPLMYQDAQEDGHKGAVRVANIQGIQRVDGQMRAWGSFDISDNADEAVRQIANEMLRGVSVDVDDASFAFEDSEGNPLEGDAEFADDTVMVITDGRISGATLVSIPAFQEAFVALGEPPAEWGVESVGSAMAESDEFTITFETVSDKPWSDFGQSDYTDEQWYRATILHKNGDSRSKSDNGLPIREPSGTLNRNGVHAAASRFNQVDAPAEAKSSAKSALRGAYRAIGEEVPDALASGEHEEFVGGQPDAGIPGHMPRVLHSYWTHGAGAAKIAWGTPGDFNRCRAALGEYVDKRMLSGLCAKLHNDAVGHWPGPGRGNAGETVDFADGVSMTEPCDCALTASGVLNDYADPQLSGPTPLTVTEDGRVFGHLATWGTCHIGFTGQCITPPTSRTGYAYFQQGEVLTADGQFVAVGHVTLGTGHADPSFAASSAVAHYDDTGTVVADVAAGDDDHGIWLAGRVRDNLDDNVIHSLRAAALSGDWRRIGGNLELVAALAVNVPGFPIPRTRTQVGSRGQTALVASGVVTQPEPDPADDSITAAVVRALDLIRARERRASRARAIAARVGRDPATRAREAAALVHGDA